jgi:8-oxo-dGTP pyrophosphatase MutT (NUDIX family)
VPVRTHGLPYLAKVLAACTSDDRHVRGGDNRAPPAAPPLAMTPDDPFIASLADYRRRHPEDAALADLFIALAGDADDPWMRGRLAGHFTASALVVSANGDETLLMHHARLGRWLQPGGHADGDRALERVALREVEEETGLVGARLEPGIFDLDRHWIPMQGDVPGHWHHDVRYVVRAGDPAVRGNHESLALAWRPVAEVADDPALDPSLRRMAARWLARHGQAAPAARTLGHPDRSPAP